MKRQVRDLRGQSVIEYSLVISLFVAAIIAMSGIIWAHTQANWKQNADAFSDEQYEEGRSTTAHNLTVDYQTTQIEENGSGYNRTFDGELGCYVWRR
jgi:Flp pilus assembly pilin Flp